MPDDQDVDGSSSTAQPEVAESDPASVNSGVAVELPADRPVENVRAEFARKIGKVEAVQNQILALLQQQQQMAPAIRPAAAPQSAEYTDEQLLQLGTPEAMSVLNQRQIQRALIEKERTDAVRQRLSLVLGRYPALNDAASPLGQAALGYKRTLLMQGRPDSLETVLDACQSAIADHPEIAGQAAVTSDPLRRAAVSQQAGIDGNAPRRQAPSAPSARALSKEELAMAERMGVKDAPNARKRFTQRLEQGRTTLGPVASYIREDA